MRRASPHTPAPRENADWAVLALAGTCAFATSGLLFAFGLLWDVSVNFDVAPWKAAQEEEEEAARRTQGCAGCTADDDRAPAGADGEWQQPLPAEAAAEALRCPFYRAEAAEAACPACGCHVSRLAMHEARSGAPLFKRVCPAP